MFYTDTQRRQDPNRWFSQAASPEPFAPESVTHTHTHTQTHKTTHIHLTCTHAHMPTHTYIHTDTPHTIHMNKCMHTLMNACVHTNKHNTHNTEHTHASSSPLSYPAGHHTKILVTVIDAVWSITALVLAEFRDLSLSTHS